MTDLDKLESLPKPARMSVERLFIEMPLPIAFVGNGAIQGEHGSLIDSHATIIRCNNFKISGFESKVGARITHWCIHGKVDAVPFMPWWKRWIISRFDRFRLVGIQPNPHVNQDTICFTPKAFDALLVELCKKHLGLSLHCVEDASWLYAIYEAHRFATTGFAALYLLVQFVPQVSVFGFSGLQGGHYSNTGHQHNRRHLSGAARELELIRASEKIRFYL